jgi:hypothetical protein
MEVSFGKTKLVKLLYLIDVEYQRRFSRKLTGLDWVFYHYGPYSPAIDEILKQIDLDIPQEDVVTASGHPAKIFKPSKYIDSEFEYSTGAAKPIVDRVINQWGFEELNPLLSYVYFHTEPMMDANRGDSLDFSKITRQIPERKQVSVQIPKEQIERMRAKFRQTKEYHLSQSLDIKCQYLHA